MTIATFIARSVDFIPWGLRNRIRRMPFLAAFQRWLLDRFMTGREFVHRISAGPAKGLNFRIRLPDDKLYWTGTWEQDVTKVIAANVPAGAVCCDVGSHRGFMAGVLALNGARRVYCFEPNPVNIAALEGLRENNSDLPLTPLGVAVGSADGEAEFALMPETTMGKLSTSSFQSGVERSGVLKVTVRSLDSLIAAGDIEVPAFLKIDIEGAEYDALQGARQLIADHRPVMLIELHSLDLLKRCRALLEAAGYNTSFVQDRVEMASEAEFHVCHMLAVPG